MVGIEGHEAALAHHHRLLVVNCLAQSQALMLGRFLGGGASDCDGKGFSGPEAERQAAHRVFAGNRPSTTLIYSKLTPQVLGQLIALYEHRVFVEGVVLGINSFDQWGVELGKELAVKLEPVLSGAASASSLDPSTELLVERIKKTSASIPRPFRNEGCACRGAGRRGQWCHQAGCFYYYCLLRALLEVFQRYKIVKSIA